MARGLCGDGIDGQRLQVGVVGRLQGLAGQEAAPQREGDLPGHDEPGAAGGVVVAYQPTALHQLRRHGRPAAGAQRAHGRPPGQGLQHSEGALGQLPRGGPELGQGRWENGRIRGFGPQAEGVRAEDVHQADHGPGIDHQGEPAELFQVSGGLLRIQAEGLGQGVGVLHAEGDDGLGDGEGGGVEVRQGGFHAGAGAGAGRERGEGGRRRSRQVGTGDEELDDVGIGQGGEMSGEFLKTCTGSTAGGRGTRAPLGALLAAVPLGPCAHSHYSSAPASVRHLGRRDRCGRAEAQKSRKQSGQCVARITSQAARDLG